MSKDEKKQILSLIIKEVGKIENPYKEKGHIFGECLGDTWNEAIQTVIKELGGNDG